MSPPAPVPSRVGAALLWTAVLVGACVVPRRSLPTLSAPFFGPIAPFIEPVAHVLLFVVSAALWMRAFPRRAAHVLVGGLAVALLTEAIQTLPGIGRGAEVMDVVLDLVGVALGALIVVALRWGRSNRVAGQPV